MWWDHDSLDTFLEYCATKEGLKEGEQVIQKENGHLSSKNQEIVKTQDIKGPWVTEDQGDCNGGIKTKGKNPLHCSKYQPD